MNFTFFFNGTGLFLHESGVLGASPDGIVRRGPSTFIHTTDPLSANLQPQLLEIKCPHSARNLTVMDAVQSVKGFYLGLYQKYGLLIASELL